ncbi:MAG: Hsp20/alpha crystallin family protein [Candidatus Krumholzibacteria bacterium]|nr:Hsp20/alpha crystallin family protein [Candidatus Krumholzibacteria bacterium]
MTLIKYRPLDTMDTFFDRMNRELWPGLDRLWNGEQDGEVARTPRTNIVEHEDHFVVTMEMPGLSKQDVEVGIEGDVLIVKGGREQEQKSEEKGIVRREFRSARFERSFTVGKDVDPDQVKAGMENGILTVTLPKRAEKVGRRIDIA